MSDRYGIDSHKLIYHPRRVAELLEAVNDWQRASRVHPLYVEISPIGACNHRCTFCAFDYIGYPARRLDAGVMAERLAEMGRLGVKSVMFAGEGEPLLHTGLTDMVLAARGAGLDVALTTNASVMPERFLAEALPQVAWLKASINAGTAETFARVHRTDAEQFERVLENLRRADARRREAGAETVLGAQAVLLPENADEMEQLAATCRDDLGLDYLVVKPYSQHLMSDHRDYQGIDYAEYLPLAERLAGYNCDAFQVVFRAHTMRKYHDEVRYPRCYATPYLWAHVMADGAVYGCQAFLQDRRFEYGNLLEQGFAEIWQGERRRENWRFVREELDIGDCRRNCRMDEVNRYLHRVVDAPVPHVNFI